MIDNTFIQSPEYQDYLDNKEEISKESVVFVEDKERLITQGKEYQFVPSGGESGQVLQHTENGPEWQDLPKVDLTEVEKELDNKIEVTEDDFNVTEMRIVEGYDPDFPLTKEDADELYASKDDLNNIDLSYEAGTGLTIDGYTINHTNSITPDTKGTTTTTTAGATAGAIPVVGGITYDSEGHITAVYQRSLTLSNTTYTFSTATFAEGNFTNTATKTFTATGGARTIYVPTKTSHLENDSNFATTDNLKSYLPTSGGTLTNTKIGNYTISIISDRLVIENEKRGKSVRLLIDDTYNLLYGYPTGNIELGNPNYRFKTVYAVEGNISGNLTVGGTINGTTVANLITRDDLAQVLTTAQMTKLNTIVDKRIADHEAAVAAARQAEALLAEKEQQMESDGEITKPSKPSVEGNETA